MDPDLAIFVTDFQDATKKKFLLITFRTYILRSPKTVGIKKFEHKMLANNLILYDWR